MSAGAAPVMRRRLALRLGQLGWLVAIWLASVATLALVATAVRLLMASAGLTR
jgi:Protein of unknown function (DUF2474)